MTHRPSARRQSTSAAAATTAGGLTAAWQHRAAAQTAVLIAIAARRRAQATHARAQFTSALQGFQRAVETAVHDFAHQAVPAMYEQGAATAAATLGAAFTWTSSHEHALQAFTADTDTDMLRHSQQTVRRAGQFYRAARAAARQQIPTALTRRTALQAATALADQLAATHPLDRVVYRNGARMPVRAWAEAAALARTAVAYNAGTLTVAREHDIQHVEVFDGSDCRWTSHPDPDKATRTLRTVEDAAQWPIAHPRCTRAFGLRPDAQCVESGAWPAG
ncbi:hypothetical protein [Kitasatospora sp. CB02891]|uniref:hypothetical protein n=1 Tax=Kitasatospora sp. CB02891 TaxID=2020329 RepID=UPI000C27C4F6|nr:hypothetical protein [Kitasatospora sp. CB02891]PJN25678.1 hypothetical protein CG736_15030 [Kitasatospora sp. CB02891]